jgi:hypothetical protein
MTWQAISARPYDWVTDTMAGAAIGVLFVSGSVVVLRAWQHQEEE